MAKRHPYRPTSARCGRPCDSNQQLQQLLTFSDVLAPLPATRSRAELLAAFEQAGVPCGPINDMADDDPQTRQRELALSLPHSRGVDVPQVRSPLRFSDTPVQHRASPMPGEHK